MAGRNEGCASIGCLGFCFFLFVAMCTGGGSEGGTAGMDPPANPPTATFPTPRADTEPQEWLYIHGTINVRAAPNRDAPIVRTLRRGDMVQLGRPDENGWARIYTGAAGDEYVYRDSDRIRDQAPAAPALEIAPDRPPRRRSAPASRQLHVGPRGGCYYINSSGNKQYVDRSECY